MCQLLERHSDDETFTEKRLKKSIKLGYRGMLGGSDNE